MLYIKLFKTNMDSLKLVPLLSVDGIDLHEFFLETICKKVSPSNNVSVVLFEHSRRSLRYLFISTQESMTDQPDTFFPTRSENERLVIGVYTRLSFV